MATKKTCSHLDQIRSVSPRTQGCEECLATGQRWVQLRMCLSCGHVGCCDSSPGKHATGHFHETHHAVMRSAEPGDAWGWCYVDQAMLAPEDLGMGAALQGPA
jgi:uncharacterized UBP type Zn finger protein